MSPNRSVKKGAQGRPPLRGSRSLIVAYLRRWGVLAWSDQWSFVLSG